MIIKGIVSITTVDFKGVVLTLVKDTSQNGIYS